MIHGIGLQVAALTFKVWDDAGNDIPDNDEDQRLILRRKAWRVKKFTEDRGRVRNACIALVVSLPLDHLWRTVQWREEKGSCLQDLVVGHSNIFLIALQEYSIMLCGGTGSGWVFPFLRHWSTEGTEDQCLGIPSHCP
jgi:hypothetical protein